MLRAYSFCYYGGEQEEVTNALVSLYDGVFSNSTFLTTDESSGLPTVPEVYSKIYIPIKSFLTEESSLYKIYKTNPPISGEVCKKKTIRQVFVTLQRTSVLRYHLYENGASIDNASFDKGVRVLKAVHDIVSTKGIMGINYKTRQGLGFTIDLPAVGWRKKYIDLEKPYVMSKTLYPVIQDCYNSNNAADASKADATQRDVVIPMGWFKTSFVVSDFSKEMFSFVQDNDYWQFVLRVDKVKLETAFNRAVEKYAIDSSWEEYKQLERIKDDVFALLWFVGTDYVPPDIQPPYFNYTTGSYAFYSFSSVIVNILVEE